MTKANSLDAVLIRFVGKRTDVINFLEFILEFLLQKEISWINERLMKKLYTRERVFLNSLWISQLSHYDLFLKFEWKIIGLINGLSVLSQRMFFLEFQFQKQNCYWKSTKHKVDLILSFLD